MATYLSPGVYVEEVPGGARAIEGVGTSTAAFVGETLRGPVNQAELVTSMEEFATRFGGVRDLGAVPDMLGLALDGFFANGGRKAYVLRVAGAASGTGRLVAVDPSASGNRIVFTAVSSGDWSDAVHVTLTREAAPSTGYRLTVEEEDAGGNRTERERFTGLSLTPADATFIETIVNASSTWISVDVRAAAAGDPAVPVMRGRLVGGVVPSGVDFSPMNTRTLLVTVDGGAQRTVTFASLTAASTLAAVATQIQTQVRAAAGATPGETGFTAAAADGRLTLTSGSSGAGASVAVAESADALAPARILSLTAATGAAASSTLTGRLAGGSDAAAGLADYLTGLAALGRVTDANIVCLPGQSLAGDALASSRAVIQAAIGQAETLRNRMVLVDPDPTAELRTEADVAALSMPTSPFAALYYPWLDVANRFHDADLRPDRPRVLRVPPCGHVAGIWARTDGSRGVWKAPAGLEASVRGALRLAFDTDALEQEALNPNGVNALRRIVSDPVVWGSRTLATRSNPEWRYVPVRRTAIFLAESIRGGTQWAVFEPNNHLLWAALRVSIESFMDIQFRAGAFQGETARQAYFVRCGLGDTMTQADIDAGRVVVLVGFAPLKPAEFVIIRIQQKAGQTQ